jgi:hypothetical protein
LVLLRRSQGSQNVTIKRGWQQLFSAR